MKLRNTEPLEKSLSPEQKTQIELARIEVAKEKAKRQMNSGVQFNIIWATTIGIVLISLMIVLATYNNAQNVIKSKERIAIENLNNEKILNGYEKKEILNQVNFTHQWKKSE